MQRKNRLKIWNRVKLHTEGTQDIIADLDPLCPSEKLRLAGFQQTEKQLPSSVRKHYSSQEHTLLPWGSQIEVIKSGRIRTTESTRVSAVPQRPAKSAQKLIRFRETTIIFNRDFILENYERLKKNYNFDRHRSTIVCEYPCMESKTQTARLKSTLVPPRSHPLPPAQDRSKQNSFRTRLRKIEKLLLL